MKIATSELEHLREEVKNCHRIIKDLQKKREFVGLTDDEIYSVLENLQVIHHRPPTTDSRVIFARAIEAKLKEKNT